MNDRRDYSRIMMSSNVMVFVEGYEGEIDGVVSDLSEESIGIRCNITEEQKKLIEAHQMITFQFVDAYMVGKRKKTEVVQACALIKRVNYSDGECFIGGYVRDENYRRYVIRRKMSAFYKW